MSSLDQLIAETASTLQTAWAMEEPHYCPYTLYPKQRLFLDLPHREVLYGGAAGAAKSVAILAGALEHVDNPQYSAVVLRNTFANLSKRGALMDLAHEWLSTSGAQWKDAAHMWKFPSGATLGFGYLDSERDKYNFQGPYYNFIGFDELTQIRKEDYTYLMSRLRTTSESGLVNKVRATSNPGGEYHQWVMDRFIPEGFTTVDAATQLFYEKNAVNSAGEMVTRAFVPGLLRDNLALDKEDYIKSLAELDPVLREQLLKGDWIIKERGDIFPSWDERRHVITWSEFAAVVGIRRIPEDWLIGIGLDWGSTEKHPCVVSFLARAPERSPLAGKVFLYKAIMCWNEPPRAVASLISTALRQDNAFDRVYVWLMSHEAKSERDTFVMDHSLPFGPWKPDKTGGIAQVRDFLEVRGTKPDLFHPQLIGSPSLYFIVEDDELLFARTDAGLVRHRLEMPLYHYDPSGLPHKMTDDAIDSLRGVASVFFPPIAPISEQELMQQRLNSFKLDVMSGPISDTEAFVREQSRQYHLSALIEEEKAKLGAAHPLDAFKRTHNV